MASADFRLGVVWLEPETRQKHRIGTLWKDPAGQFVFQYTVDELSLPESRGFMLLPEFPSRDETYRASRLFFTFAQRVPSRRRKDFVRILDTLGLPHNADAFTILAASNGRQMTDRIELYELRPDDDDLSRPLSFRVAGMNNYEGANNVSEGDELVLRREPTNEHDPQATVVLLRNGEILGYVPRTYTAIFTRLLDAGVRLTAVAERRVSVPLSDPKRWIVRACRAA